MAFQFAVEGFVMPLVSTFGLVGNGLSVYVLRQKEVKLKHDFVQASCKYLS